MAKARVYIEAPTQTRSWQWPSWEERWAWWRREWHFNALLALLVLCAVPAGTVGPWWETWFECSVFALTGGWLVRRLRAAQAVWQVPGADLLLPWGLLLLLAVLQILPLGPLLPGWVDASQSGAVGGDSPLVQATVAAKALSASPFETWRFVLKLLAILLAVLLLRSGVEGDAQRYRRLAHTVIGIGAGSALFALLRLVLQSSSAPFVFAWLSPGIGFGQFINHNHFAFLMEMTWGLACGLALAAQGERRQRQRTPAWLMYGGVALLAWLALVLANSRGGIYSMLGQLCCLLAWWPRLRHSAVAIASPGDKSPQATAPVLQPARVSLWRQVVTSSSLVLVIVIGVIWIGGDSLATRFEQLSREIGVEGVLNPRLQVRRIEMWQATWQLIQFHPMLGSGLGAFEPAVTPFYDASGNWTLRQAHNDYLELVAGGGLLSAFLVGWFAVAVVWQGLRQLKTPWAFQRGAGGGALVGLVGVALHSSVDFGLHLPVIALLCGALVVLATAQRLSVAARD